MIHQATSFMVKQNRGNQMIVQFVFVVMAPLNAWLRYVVTQIVKNLCILRDSAVLSAPWLTQAHQGIMKRVRKKVYSSIFKWLPLIAFYVWVFYRKIHLEGSYYV